MKAEGFPFIEEKETISKWDRAGRAKNAIQYKKEIENAKDIEVLDLQHVGGSHGFFERLDEKETKLYYIGGEGPEYAGLNAEILLQNKSISESKKVFKEYIKDNLNIDIPESEIGFHFGEVSS
jgi:hypothetical protein